MKIIDFKSSDEIIKYLDDANNLEMDLEKELKSLRCGIFNKTYKSNKKAIKNKLDYLKNNVVSLTKFMKDAVTFDQNVFLKFMVRFLELMENKPYIIFDNVENNGNFVYLFTESIFLAPLESFSDNIDFINSLGDLKYINNDGKSVLCDEYMRIDEILGEIEGEKYINLKRDNSYCLLDGIKLAEPFSKYPYLLKVAKLLIDLKIQCPKLSDEVRLNLVYESVKKKVEELRSKNTVRY